MELYRHGDGRGSHAAGRLAVTLLLFLLAFSAPDDAFVVQSIMDVPVDSMLVIHNVPDADVVLSVTIINRCPIFHRGARGYAYEVVLVGRTTGKLAWIWDTAYMFYQEDGEWLFYNDESLESKIRFRRGT